MTQDMSLVALKALDYVQDKMAVGLGTGRAATAFVHALGQRVAAGLQVRCVPTSQSTADLATKLGIPLTTLADTMPLDLTVDGADEVDPDLNLIKGLGGALVREKIVAAASRRLVILVDAGKEVKSLGAHRILPVEVVPFGLGFVKARLAALGYEAGPRMAGGKWFISDNGNYILDCTVAAIPDAASLDQTIRSIPGVVGTGFVGMAHTVLVLDGETVRSRQRAGV
jgi:ribose 5-phosphate isomerase A